MFRIRKVIKLKEFPSQPLRVGHNSFKICRFCTSASQIQYKYDSDPAPLFLNEQVQQWLKSMTRLRIETVFRKRSVKENTTVFKFMTTTEIKEEIEKALKEADRLLQMPPVVQIKKDVISVVSEPDSALISFDDSDYVFTDITFGLKSSDRMIVKRSHKDGSLKTVDHEVAKRINQTYFPLKGRSIRMPKLFEADNLRLSMSRGQYEFILDKLCIQFEPNDAIYHEICSEVYLHIDENKQFDSLRSTRHFGPMAFFLAWHRVVDNLLLDMIKRDYLTDAVDLVLLTCKLKQLEAPKSDLISLIKKSATSELHDLSPSTAEPKFVDQSIGKSLDEIKIDCLCVEAIKHFVENHALKKVQLQLATQTLLEQLNSKRELAENINKAHGLQSQ